MRKNLTILSVILFICWLPGCRPKLPAPPIGNVSAGAGHDYIDLEPGSTVRVIIPLSGTGVLTTVESSSATAEEGTGNTLTSSAPKDFAGYETDSYTVSGLPGGGVRVRFEKAEVTRDGETVPRPQSLAPLFELPKRVRYVRLLFLRRVSEADHNMAILAANKPRRLMELTIAVQENQAACVNNKDAACTWVPLGFAVRPEPADTH